MTSLLLHWLNDELALHRKINVLERDLCNGYILAEVLHIHGFENHLERYTDDADLASRVANLELLDKAMISAGLGELGTAIKRKIMMEDRSTILQLVLQLKEFIESRRKKTSIQQQQLQNDSSKVYEPRAPVNDPTRIVQDIEERFIKETAKQYEPKEVRFYKDVNSAIFLRKFPQAQWQAENDQIEYEAKAKAENADKSAKSMAALRARMSDKRAFMKDWDQQRLEKWQQTQKMYLQAERDDLRLELTLEERRRRFHDAKVVEVQADARNGVLGFEKSMNRLGLSTSGGATEPVLRAIPSSDPGAVAHLDRLEERVKELGFRPSNNIQMMKELRARRAAQLAAEKDRRMRRMKAVSDSNRAASSQVEASVSQSTYESTTAGDAVDKSSPTPINIQDAFIEEKRDALEANYARLREAGAVKRELEANELQRLRLDKREKAYERSKHICLSIVDDLISMSIACSECRPSGDLQSMSDWAQYFWQQQSSSFSPTTSQRTFTKESRNELQMLTQAFLSLSDSFSDSKSYTGDAIRPPQNISNRIDTFVRVALAVPSPEILETKWTKLNSSKLVAIFTSDERGHRLARTVAIDHSLHYVNIEEVFEECVKYSYDPVKQADAAASLGHRERELGAFGPKITALRQKNSPVPEALAVDVVLAFISSAQQTVMRDENDVVQPVAPLEGSEEMVGFLLHNFPRTLEEWKVFEKGAIGIANPELLEEAKVERLMALDAALSDTLSSYRSVIDCAVVVSTWEPTPRTTTPSASGLTPSPSTEELGVGGSDRRRSTEASKRQLAVDPAVVKAEAEQEMLVKRRQVEDTLTRTSRTVRIDQEEMDERVLQELVHLTIDVYASEKFSDQTGVLVECTANAPLPYDLDSAREHRRSTMPVQARIAWMVAAKQLQLSEQTLFDVVVQLRRIEQTQSSNLLRLFEEAFVALENATLSARTAHQHLDEILGAVAISSRAALKNAQDELRSHPSRAEKILISAEVVLGDVVDAQRTLANRFVDETATDPFQPSRAHVLSWLRLLPVVCHEIKELVVDTVHALHQGFFSQFGFLGAASAQVLPASVPSRAIEEMLEAAKVLDRCCVESGIPLLLQPEVVRIANQFVCREESTDNKSGGSCQNELEEVKVSSALADTALQRMTTILRWSVKVVENVKSVHATDVDAMRRYISRDLTRSNTAISDVMKQLAAQGSASWPDITGHHHTRSPTLLRHQQSALLGPSQVAQLISALTIADTLTGLLPRDEFTSTVVDVARREGFPDVWQDFTNVARVSLAWSSSASAMVPWRHVVFGLICAQCGVTPTTQALEETTDQLLTLPSPRLTDVPLTITRSDFVSRTKLWFEDGSLAPGEATALKELIFSLYANGNEADVCSLLFAFCAAPTSARGVHTELSTALLPRYSRGLLRVHAVLTRWKLPIDPMLVRRLVAFVGVGLDETRLQETTGFESDASAFLSWCDRYDPAIARQLTVYDTLAALVNHP